MAYKSIFIGSLQSAGGVAPLIFSGPCIMKLMTIYNDSDTDDLVVTIKVGADEASAIPIGSVTLDQKESASIDYGDGVAVPSYQVGGNVYAGISVDGKVVNFSVSGLKA